MKTIFYLLLALAYSGFASPLDKGAEKAPSPQTLDLESEDVNVDELSSRLWRDWEEELERINDDDQAQASSDNSIKVEEHNFKENSAQGYGAAEATEPVFQPFPGLKELLHDLNTQSGYSQFENLQGDREGEKDNRELPDSDTEWSLPNIADDDQVNSNLPDNFLEEWANSRPGGLPNSFKPDGEDYGFSHDLDDLPNLNDDDESGRAQDKKDTKKQNPKN